MLRHLLLPSFLAVLLTVTSLPLGCVPPPEEREAPETRQLTILWSGTIRGELTECDCPLAPGGLPRLASLVAEQRESSPDLSILVDVGDVAGDPREEQGVVVESELARRVRAELAYEALGFIGFDLYVPGERDLTLGVTPLVEQIEDNGGRLLSSNLWWANQAEPVGEPYHLVETELGSVALIGVSQQITASEELAARRGHDPEIEMFDPSVSLDLTLDALPTDVSFVVVFAHGTNAWARELLGVVDGVDVCVVAHEDSDPREIEQIGDAFLIKTAREAKSLGRLDILLRSDGTITFSGYPLAPTEEYERDPAVLELVDELGSRLRSAQQTLDNANVEAPHPSGGTYLGFSACGECHAEQMSSWLTTPHVSAFQALQSIGWHVVSECFECHSTGFGYATGFRGRAVTPMLSGVTCEACHGPASRDVHDPPGESGYGEVSEETCRRCHTNLRDPDFDFEAALPLVSH